MAADLISRGFTDVVHIQSRFPDSKEAGPHQIPPAADRAPGTGGKDRLMRIGVRRLLTFPNPVNEYAARSVAGMVVLLCIATLVVRTSWPLWPLALGFVARVASGPRFSPFGQLATRVIAPRLGPAKLVPGPPKRFAQTIGATLSVGALVAYYLGAPTVSWMLVGMITAAAFLESVFGFCLGCAIFGRLQAIGLIPASVCEACNDIRLRHRAAAAG